MDLFAKEKLAWLEDCRLAARKLLSVREEITIEDVLAVCPRPSYIHRNTTGQVFKCEDFKACGWTKARKLSSRGRWIMKWRLSDHVSPQAMRQLQLDRLETE